MNYSEMQDQVRLLLGETDADNSYYTATEIEDQINLSNLRVASEVPTLLTYAEVDSVADTQQYGLPSDFLQLKDVQYWRSTTQRIQLIRYSYDEFEILTASNATMSGEPAFYRVEFGAVKTDAGTPPGDIWLYPVPDAVYTLRVVYYQKPTALSSDADVSELPEFLHLPVCYHAALHLAMKDSANTRLGILANMYRDAIREAKLVVSKRDRSGPFQIRTNYGKSRLIRRGGRAARRGPLK